MQQTARTKRDSKRTCNDANIKSCIIHKITINGLQVTPILLELDFKHTQTLVDNGGKLTHFPISGTTFNTRSPRALHRIRHQHWSTALTLVFAIVTTPVLKATLLLKRSMQVIEPCIKQRGTINRIHVHGIIVPAVRCGVGGK